LHESDLSITRDHLNDPAFISVNKSYLQYTQRKETARSSVRSKWK